MNLQHIPAGEYPGNGGLHVLVHHRAIGPGVHLRPQGAGQLVLRQQAHAQQQGVARKNLFRAGNGLPPPVHGGHHDFFQPPVSDNIGNGMREEQRDIIIPETLDDIPVQAAGVGHQLHAGQHLGPLQGHPPGHDEPDVSAAQDHRPSAHHFPLDVDEPLGRPCGEDAGASGPRHGDGPPGPLTAAHGQDHGPGPDRLAAAVWADVPDGPVGRNRQDHGVRFHLNGGTLQHVNEPPGVLRTGKLLLKAVEAEAVVDALVENAAQICVPLQQKDICHPRLPGGQSGGQARRAAADDGQLVFLHAHASFVSPVRM